MTELPITADDAATSSQVEDTASTAHNESLSGESRAAMAARIGVNDNKAGMEGLDKDKINKIILEASKGSKFYENELKKDKIILKKIESLKEELSKASESQLNACLAKADTLLASLYLQYDFTRYIVHMDMDAFFAAVEVRDNPELRDIPMAVGGEDMLSTSNYAARRFGVRAAMPGFIARKLCPQLVIVPSNYRKYTAVSKDIAAILLQYDVNMNPMSLDEAYIDFTGHMTRRSKLSEASRTFPVFSETLCRCISEERESTNQPKDSTDNLGDDSSDGKVSPEDHAIRKQNDKDSSVHAENEGNVEGNAVCTETRGNADDTPVCTETRRNAEENPVYTKTRGNADDNPVENPVCTKTDRHAKKNSVCTETDGNAEENPVCTETRGNAEENSICTETQGNAEDNLVCTDTDGNAEENPAYIESEVNSGNTKPDNRPTDSQTSQQQDAPKTGMSLCERCNLPINPNKITFGLGIEDAVKEMRHRIHLKTKLTASAGIAPNCLIAKICSDRNKPNGQYMLPFTVEAAQDFMKDLPIRKVPGIGKVSEKQLTAFDIRTCQDFYKHRDILCFLYSGGSFDYFMSVYMGIGSNSFTRNDEGPKSKSVERTFRSMSEPNELQNMCYDLSMELAEDLKAAHLTGKTVTLKIKLVTFEQKTRCQSLSTVTNDGEEIYNVASSLLKTEIKGAHPKSLRLRLMGVRMSNFASIDSKQQKLQVIKSKDESTPDTSLSFFDQVDQENRKRKNQKPVESLGLLAYMADYKATPAKNNATTSADELTSSKHPDRGLDRFSIKRKNVWDDVAERPPGKVKPGTKGTVTICSLLDTGSDSNTDPWSALDNSAPNLSASTPHSKGAVPSYGPLDFYRSHDGNVPSPWSTVTDTNTKTTNNPEAGPSNSSTTNKSVQSYFTKTKSVWDDLKESSDDQIICLSNSPPQKTTKTRLKPGKTKSHTRGKRASSDVSKPLVNIFNASKQKTRSQIKEKRKTGPKIDTDCQIITLDSD